MIIYADIVGDLLHYGHINFLKKCRELSDEPYLIVGVHSDEECAQYKRLPIMTVEERVKSVLATGLADEVITNAPLYPTKDYLQDKNIDIVAHAHSEDEEEKYKLMYKSANELNIFRRLEYTPEISTTTLINRIISRGN